MALDKTTQIFRDCSFILLRLASVGCGTCRVKIKSLTDSYLQEHEEFQQEKEVHGRIDLLSTA